MVRVNHFKCTGILSLCFFVQFQTNLYSQTEGDIFLYGFCSYTYEFETCESPFNNSIVRFLNDTIISDQAIDNRGYFGESKSAFNNENVTYFSNGLLLAKKDGIIDTNLLEYDIINSNFYDSYRIATIQTPLFLNVKDDDREKVYLLYNKTSYEIYRDTLFAYAELSNNQVPNNEVIISKRNPILLENDTTLIGSITACRHANGRDWWVTKVGKYHDEIYQGILDFNGLTMQKIYTSAPDFEYKRNGAVCTFFNLSGNKYYIFSFSNSILPTQNIEEKNFIYVYDFDRCNGMLYNLVSHDVSNYTVGIDNNYSCLSPDGTKMYISKSYNLDSLGNIIGEGGIFQYDFITRIFQKINGPNNSYPILSPNGKWVLVHNMTTPPEGELLGQPTFDIIYNPNELGQNCNYQENQVILSSFGVGFPPNLANFRLGPVDGSICDSLGLDAPVNIAKAPEITNVKIYPNPSNGLVKFDFDNINKRSIGLYNSQGQRIHRLEASEKTIELDLKSFGFSSGLYFIEINDLVSNQRFYSKIIYHAH